MMCIFLIFPNFYCDVIIFASRNQLKNKKKQVNMKMLIPKFPILTPIMFKCQNLPHMK